MEMHYLPVAPNFSPSLESSSAFGLALGPGVNVPAFAELLRLDAASPAFAARSWEDRVHR